jgi:hypothetical protein
VVVAAANADQGVLTAVQQLLAHTVKGTPINPGADHGKYKFTVIDKGNVPAAAKFFYDPGQQIAAYVARWKTEYGL